MGIRNVHQSSLLRPALENEHRSYRKETNEC
jgi:hypothetical protein